MTKVSKVTSTKTEKSVLEVERGVILEDRPTASWFGRNRRGFSAPISSTKSGLCW